MKFLCRDSRNCPRLLIFTLFLFFISANFSLFAAEWQEKYNYVQTRQQFEQPPLWYAPHAFWFWDDTLDVSVAESMAEEMTTQHLNPGYAHPRHSDAPDKPYPSLPKAEWLSPKWFDCFSAALTNAEKADMTLGYCDEYWWPSGQAAGRVLEKHPELASQSLSWKRQVFQGPKDVNLPDNKFTVAAQLNDKDTIIANTLRVIGEDGSFNWNVPTGKWVVYSYSVFHHPGVDNGQVNYLDPKLMDMFIPIAHESYEKYLKDKMGNSIPGVFVDNEGDYGWQMAWSDYLPVRYMEMKNRDICLWMPLLTEEDENGIWAKARYDWFDVVSDIYSTQFLGRLSNWLNDRDMYYISNLWEEDLMLQTRAVGDFMRSQRAVSLPGNDCLQMKSQQVHDFKETQSVCEFEDRPFMSELMGVAGWEQTPVQMKKTLNAVTAWGITHTVPHGINLNRKVETIPYPADWYTENPYWRYLHLWTDFARRASFVNRQGQLVADILLVNPLESAWALSEGYFTSHDGKEWPDKVIEINDTYSDAMQVLSDSRLDYLIADKYYLEKATITQSAQKSVSPLLSIADHDFSVIVLPPMFILSQTSAQKILDFANSGGTVVLLGDLPQGSPEVGANDPVIVSQFEKLVSLSSVIDLANEPENINLLPAKIKNVITPQVEIQSGDFPLLVSHRKIGGKDFYWMVNSTEQKQNCSLLLRDGSGKAEIWDCETGAIRNVSSNIINNRVNVDLILQPYEAYWVVLDPAEKFAQFAEKEIEKKEINLGSNWSVSFPETDSVLVTSAKSFISLDVNNLPNVLEPDFDDSNWRNLNILGETRFIDTWRAKMLYIPFADTRRYYRYNLDLKDDVEKSLININADNSVRFWVNGTAIEPGILSSSMRDADIHDISPFLQKGKNCIAVEATNRPGFGWMLFQGQILLKNGSIIEILSDSTWKESDKEMPGWHTLDFNDAAWGKPLVANELQMLEISKMRDPQKLVPSTGILWWRMGIPPGAKACRLYGLSKKAELFVDGKKIKAKNNLVAIPTDAKVLVVKNYMGENGLSQPAVFYCDNSSNRQLCSWIDMGLRRFTGFVDYETSFNVAEKDSILQIDLGKVLHMAEVWVNDEKVGERLWPPFTFTVKTPIKQGKNTLCIRVGNLMVNEMGLKDDLGKLRTWGWVGTPPDSCYDAGLFGPVKLYVE